MALTNKGFNGTVEEADFARMFGISATDGVDGAGAWAVTQGTGRQTSTAAQSGWAFAKGVISKDTAAILTSLGTPTNGQWYLIVRRVNWSTDTVSVVAIAHTTTSTTIPAASAAPVTYPTMSVTPGVEYDQPLAWAWVRSTDTTMVLADLRKLPLETRIAAAEAAIVVRAVQWFKPADATALTALTGMNNGDFAVRQDNGITYKRVAGAWKAWESDPITVGSPTMTGVTVGNGTLVTKYQYAAGKIKIEYTLTFGSTTTITGDVKCPLPVNAAASSGFDAGFLANAGRSGVFNAPLSGVLDAVGSVSIFANTTGSTYEGYANLTMSIPAAFGTGAVISVKGEYQP